MTIDEAISIMNVIVHMIEPQYDTDRIEDAVEIAIKALEQEPYGDCISRDAVMHILDEVGGDFDSPREAVVPIDYIADMVAELPSVTPQPKMGRWIFDEVLDHHYYCSECKAMGVDYWDYCPNCGCAMKGELE